MATVSQSIELENAVSRFGRAFQAAELFAERLERVSADGERIISTRLDYRGMALREAGESFSSSGRAQSTEIGENAGDGKDEKDAEKNIENMEKRVDKLKSSWDKVGGAVKKALSFLSVRNVTAFVDEVFRLDSVQMTAELNLATALNNNGQGAEAFDAIRRKATAISGATMYGDEAMIAGASELSAYVSDPAAVMAMMDTLADYAAGMSGGGAVDSAAMAEYAARLGQAVSGSFGVLEESGFGLSAAQREIMENGSEMEKALVLDEVISGSWDGLAESVRSTPVGMITAIGNALRDIGEKIGAKIAPKFMRLADSVCKFLMSSGVQDVIGTIVFLLGMTFDILEWGVGILQVIADNWDTVGAVLLTVASALGLYTIATGTALIKTRILTAEVKAAKREQTLLNTALNNSSLLMAAGGFGLAAGAIAVYTKNVNKSYGLSLSFSGMLGGSLMTVLGTLGNIVIALANYFVAGFDYIWNTVADFANWFGNVLNNPVGAAWNLFAGFFSNMVDSFLWIYDFIDNLFGTNLTETVTKGRDNVLSVIEDKYGDEMSDTTVYMEKRDDTLKYIDLDEAFEAGYWLGDSLFNNGGEGSEQDGRGFDYDSLFNGKSPLGTEDDPIHTEVDNDINIADEDLKLLRDVAEARYVQNFVTLTPTVQVTGNTINEKVDVNSVVNEIEYRLESEFAASAEGVYC